MKLLYKGSKIKLLSGLNGIICDYYTQSQCYLVQIENEQMHLTEFRVVPVNQIVSYS